MLWFFVLVLEVELVCVLVLVLIVFLVILVLTTFNEGPGVRSLAHATHKDKIQTSLHRWRFEAARSFRILAYPYIIGLFRGTIQCIPFEFLHNFCCMIETLCLPISIYIKYSILNSCPFYVLIIKDQNSFLLPLFIYKKCFFWQAILLH